MKRHKKALENLAKGVAIPALPLALNSKREFNEKRQRVLMRYYLDAGVGGVAVAVHATQFEIRDSEIGLFEPVLKIAIEEIEKYEKATSKVIVRIGGVLGKTDQAISEATLQKSLGYDAVLLAMSGLEDYTEDEIIERTRKIAEIIPVIGFYLQKRAGGRIFSYNFWEKFVEIKNVVAIKTAPFNRYYTLDVVRAVATSSRADEIALYSGNDDSIVIDLVSEYEFKMDGKTYKKSYVGGLLGHWAVWTNSAVKMFEKLKEIKKLDCLPKDILVLANEVTDMNAVLFDTANDFSGSTPGVHEVLRRQGILEGTWCLNEKRALSPGQSEEIDRMYKMYPHLTDDAFVKENIDKWFK